MARSEINIDEIMKNVRKAADILIDDVVTTLEMACIEVVRQARLVNTYQDQTGNLRSSIGCAVYKDGVRVSENYEAHAAGESGATGVNEARSFVDEIAMGYQGRTCAIIVAGMDYAVYVESKGFDVITGSANQFASIFEKYIKTITE